MNLQAKIDQFSRKQVAKTVTDSFMCNVHVENTVRKKQEKDWKRMDNLFFFFKPSGM